jgi:hypothetical protein
MSTPTNPIELFDLLSAKGLDMLKIAFMESEKPWPGDDDPVVVGLLKPALHIGIACTTEYMAKNPETLALAGQPICTQCREPVQTLQVGAQDGIDGPVKVAWPCGHTQS